MEDRKDAPGDPKQGRNADADLAARLDAARIRMRPKDKTKQTGEIGAAMRIAVDIVAGIAVGTGIGWFLDRTFGTTPWLLVLFFVLGAAAGIRNVLKTAQRLEIEARQTSGREPPENDS